MIGRSLPGRQGRELALTGGGLPVHGLELEKSADAIVVPGNEPRTETVEASQGNEGMNVKLSEIQ